MAKAPFDTCSDDHDAPAGHWVGLRSLVVVHGPDRGKRQLLGAEPVRIGRAAGAEARIPLADASVSKLHAELGLDEARGVVVLRDHGSRNGTFVNGVRRERADLAHGDVVRVGATLLVYAEAEVDPDVPLEPPNGVLEGPSFEMQRVRGEIRRYAPHSLPALVVGESGVGKEMVAVDIHRQSRRPGPLVALNCAALSPSLAESEMFGHMGGAFTGAARRHDGLFAAAAGGTLLLDEIGEMELDLQAKLLRAVACGEVRPVGSSQPQRVDVRVIAATHVDLDAAVAVGRFRGDLLARLRGWTLRVPPLRERREDILALAHVFLRQTAGAPGLHRDAMITADAAEALLVHAWPYNVRELEQVIALAAVAVAPGEPLRLAHLPTALARRIDGRGRAVPGNASSTTAAPLSWLVERDRTPTRADLEQVLARFDGNVASAASFFGKDRRQLYRWAARLDVDPERFRT